MADLPYMKLWTQRFFGSIRVQSLPGRHRLIYLGLLVAEWGLDGKGLPNDIDMLARILGVPRDDVGEAWGDGSSGVSQFFELRSGRLFNDTLESTYLQEKKSIRAKREHGKKGAKGRWKREMPGHYPSTATAMASRDGGGDGDGSSLMGKKGSDGGALDERQVSVVEWYETQLCMPAHRAAEVVRKLGVTEADLEGWNAALSDARTKGLRDYRVFVRSRAERFRTAAEAFGVSREDQWAKVDWAALAAGGAK
jgi:hypothetical protein